MLIYAAAATLVISMAGWIAYAIAAFFVLAPFVAGFGLADRTSAIIFGLVLLPLPVGLSIWVFRRINAVERNLADSQPDAAPTAATPDSASTP